MGKTKRTCAAPRDGIDHSPLAPCPNLSLRLPAEWEPHELTWIAWPHCREDWPGKFAAIPWVYTEIVRHLSVSERVFILVNSAHAEKQAARQLTRAGNDLKQVDFFRIPADRVWTRDYGPLFVSSKEGEPAIVHWRFNAWAKYKNWKRDCEVPKKIAKKLDLRRYQPVVGSHRVVLEGGSIDVNGQGLLMTTEECLLDTVQARNPGLAREDLERVFAEYLGIRKVLWLGRGIAGDDTHGHIDDLARFVNPGTVVTVVVKDPADVNYAPLQDNLRRLRSMTDLRGKPLEIVELPMPAPVYFERRRLPASYANFYIANNRLLVPTFNDPQDRRALGILADLFPGREVIGIHAVDLVWGLGTLHCLTQQQPACV
jgi:agmatine deiminase